MVIDIISLNVVVSVLPLKSLICISHEQITLMLFLMNDFGR